MGRVEAAPQRNTPQTHAKQRSRLPEEAARMGRRKINCRHLAFN
jgi:hypothetical protein